MRKVNTADLIPGMVTAENVYNYVNQLILPKGLTLTDKSITRLEFYSIMSIRVEDEVTSAPVKQDDSKSYSERLRETAGFQNFKNTFDQAVGDFGNVLNGIANGSEGVDTDKMWNMFQNIWESKENNISVFSLLQDMRDNDDPTYAHCMNVALLTNAFCEWLHYSEEETKLATTAAMLHDIGKIKISHEIIDKPAKLTDEEYNIIKTHTLEGYNLVKETNLNDHIKNTILMHHERCDGTGYPFGLMGDRIDRFAKLVGIIDVYEAMTAKRVYRGPMCPFEVIELYENEGLQKYDTQYILTFLENIVYSFIQHRVRLNNGLEGEIVFVNRTNLSRPTIKSGSTYVDLAMERNLYIKEII